MEAQSVQSAVRAESLYRTDAFNLKSLILVLFELMFFKCYNLGNCEWMDEIREGNGVAWIFWLKGRTDVLIGGWMNILFVWNSCLNFVAIYALV